MCVLGDDGLEDVGEFRVFSQGIGGWGNGGCGAQGDFGRGRVGGEEGEDVATQSFFVREDVLGGGQHVDLDLLVRCVYNVWIASQC